MSIYVYKNNQPMGPFEESRILEWLANGQLSYEDLAIRHGTTEWTKLREMFPSVQMQFPQQMPAQQQNFYANGGSPVGAVVGPKPKKGGKGLVVLILALVGMFFVAIIGTAAIFAVSRMQRKSDPIDISKTNTNSPVPISNSNSNKTSFKALTDKSKELAKLTPPVKLDSKPVLKEKVALVQHSDTSNEYAISMQGYYSTTDTVNESDLKSFGLTPERLAKTPEEIDTLVQTLCSKGRKIGTYSSKYGVIPAYSNVCKVSIIDYKESKIIAQKSFENRKLSETTTVYPSTTEDVAIMPYEEVEKYISGISKNKK